MAAPTKEDLLFGKIAINNKIATEAQIKECLASLEKSASSAPAPPAKNGGGMALGRLLLEKGYINPGHYQAISSHVRKVAETGGGPAATAGAEGGAAIGTGTVVLPTGTGRMAAAAESSKSAAPKPAQIYKVTDVARMDFKKLAGKPLDEYLKLARQLGASDLHYHVDSPPFLRLHGRVVYLNHPPLTKEDTLPRILEILSDFEKSVFEKHNDLDFCYATGHGRYRANVLRQRKGVDAVFRVIPDRLPTLEDLHMPDTLRKFTKYRQGIVLLTGPAGCGKSSTMAALIDIINQAQYDHIVTVEDPIEYLIPSKNCNVNQRHVRVHTETFSSALRSAMRADPDYICVGEMRDLETISMAITAAETGHLVFGTLHTTNAMRSVDRIIDVFPPKEQDQIRAMVSESLRGVISQQLIPRADGAGREPALEILFTTPAVSNIIRERKTFQLISMMQTGSKLGMVMMDDSLTDLLNQGLITKEEARYRSQSPERFK